MSPTVHENKNGIIRLYLGVSDISFRNNKMVKLGPRENLKGCVC